MLAIQIAIVALTFFTLLIPAYSDAFIQVSETKIALLKTMNKKFLEKNLKGIVKQILLEKTGLSCIERKKNVSHKLKELGEIVAEKGIEMHIGFLFNGKCNCFNPGEEVLKNDEKSLAGEIILACVGSSLEISQLSEQGIAAIIFSTFGADKIIVANTDAFIS